MMLKFPKIKLVATDLDGTLLKKDRTISTKDFESIKALNEKGIKLIAATGRSLFKVKDVIPEEVPFDFIVFSSGAGIYDWQNKKLLHSEQFEKNKIESVCTYLIARELNFIVFKPIPQNNLFYFHKGAGDCSEFDHYLDRHTGDFVVLNESIFPSDVGQMMAIIPNDEILFEQIKSEIYSNCDGLKVIRATSPVNNDFIWLEIFPDSVSKGHGLNWICNLLSIDVSETLGIGNDFNDIDMLDFVAYPFVIGNGVDAIKIKYQTVAETNDENGFTKVLNTIGI